MLEQVFGGWMSLLTKPAWIREKTLDLATFSAAVEFRLRTRSITKGWTSILCCWEKSDQPMIDPEEMDPKMKMEMLRCRFTNLSSAVVCTSNTYISNFKFVRTSARRNGFSNFKASLNSSASTNETSPVGPICSSQTFRAATATWRMFGCRKLKTTLKSTLTIDSMLGDSKNLFT